MGAPCSAELNHKYQEKHLYLEILTVNLFLQKTIFLRTYSYFLLGTQMYFSSITPFLIIDIKINKTSSPASVVLCYTSLLNF